MPSIKKRAIVLFVIVLMFMPFNINGSIYTIFGNGIAENSFYSIGSFYQEAQNGEAFEFIGLGVQKGKKHTVCMIGIVKQRAQEGSATLWMGVSFQEAKEAAANVVGINLFQKAEMSFVALGINCYQSSQEKSLAGITLLNVWQKSEDRVLSTIGLLNVFQKGNDCHSNGITMIQSGNKGFTAGLTALQCCDKNVSYGLSFLQVGKDNAIYGINVINNYKESAQIKGISFIAINDEKETFAPIWTNLGSKD